MSMGASAMERRQFLSGSAAVAASLSASGAAQQAEGSAAAVTLSNSREAAARIPRVTSAGTTRGEMLYRPLGATGVEVSAIGMGGFHLGQPQVQEQDAIH